MWERDARVSSVMIAVRGRFSAVWLAPLGDENSATKTTARQGNPKGAIKRIDTTFPPRKTPSNATIERGVPPAGHIKQGHHKTPSNHQRPRVLTGY